MPSIPLFDSFNSLPFGGPKGLGHAHGTYSLRLPGERAIQVQSMIFCDDGSVLMLVRPTSSGDQELFESISYQSKLQRYVLENLSKGVEVVKNHERGGTLFEFTDRYFQQALDHLF